MKEHLKAYLILHLSLAEIIGSVKFKSIDIESSWCISTEIVSEKLFIP